MKKTINPAYNFLLLSVLELKEEQCAKQHVKLPFPSSVVSPEAGRRLILFVSALPRGMEAKPRKD